jgi:hypothetical protein
VNIAASFSTPTSGAVQGIIDRFPDKCPICHHNVAPVMLLATMKEPVTDREAQVLFLCPRHACQHVFIGNYSNPARRGMPYQTDPVYLVSCVPRTAEKIAFGKEINAVSLSFCTIMQQVEHAQTMELDQLTGIGLRKALEFLVKDFLMSQTEDQKEREEIAKTMLGPCIEQYVADTKIKQCAKRAAWLGNDETHYIRKWEDKDITDLKTLIRLTVIWIESVLLTDQYMKEMPKGR